jgi:hypothetical protein
LWVVTWFLRAEYTGSAFVSRKDQSNLPADAYLREKK